MKIAEIPFNTHLSIREHAAGEGSLTLPYSREMTNHLGTMHASAQFALAEACSGQFMLDRFPEDSERYAAVLRNSDVKYRKQTRKNVYAVAAVDGDAIRSFKKQLDKKSRAFLPVRVTIKDEEDNITMQGTFEWYVQAIEREAP